MAKSLLAAKILSAPPDNQNVWGVLEAAVELVLGALTAIGGIAPVTLTPAFTHVTTSGTVAAGKHYIQFIISSDFTGTINGATYNGSTSGGQIFPYINSNTYPAISYVVTTGAIDITSF